jgi:hypothetical protein
MFDPISPYQVDLLWALLVRSDSPRSTLNLTKSQCRQLNSEQRLPYVQFETTEATQWWHQKVAVAVAESKLQGYTYRQVTINLDE